MSTDPASVYDALDAINKELLASIAKTEQIHDKYNKLVALKNAFEASKTNVEIQAIIKAYAQMKGVDPDVLDPMFA